MNTEYCIWIYEDDYSYYETSCNNNFTFFEGDFKDNKFTFCPYCGKPIMQGEKHNIGDE